MLDPLIQRRIELPFLVPPCLKLDRLSSANRDAVRQLHDQEESGRLRRDPLFGLLGENVEWEALGPVDLVPWAGTHLGHDGVRRWFELLNAALTYERFELLELYAGDRRSG
ncbi:MAG: hypothetical protein ABI896_09405 [Actinomycetota bacterium]